MSELRNNIAVFSYLTRPFVFMDERHIWSSNVSQLRIFGFLISIITIVYFLRCPVKKGWIAPSDVQHSPRTKRSIDHGAIECHEAYEVMVQNSLNSQRIIKIIEEESSANVEMKQLKCKKVKPDCPEQPPDLKGKLHIEWKKLKKLRDVAFVSHKRAWSPVECTSRHSVAIIIPYRNRRKQLRLLLQYLPPILKRQQINYSFFIVEQVGNSTFNKGILMNAAFLTALSRPAHGVVYHCFIFHDVDLLTENDRNMYTCPIYPRHMSVAVDELRYKLPYQELVGGVFAIRTEQFIQLNGYSNLYWGWGGEDDDMGNRVESALQWKMRPPEEVARFTSIPHVKANLIISWHLRKRLLNTAKRRYRRDGLSTVKFKLKGIVERPQFTHIYVDVGLPPEHYSRLVMRSTL